MTLLDPKLREIVAIDAAEFRPYDRYGIVREDMLWRPLTDDDGYQSFLLRFLPGARSTPHEHAGGEEFLVLEGELEDADGAVLKRGDYVIYQPGSKHYSVSPQGCLLLAFIRGVGNRPATDG